MKKTQLISLGISLMVVLGMSITLPACPGQEEIKQQVDQHAQQVNALSKRVGELETQVKTLNTGMEQAKQIFSSLAPLLQQHKAQLDEMDKTLKDMQSRLPGGKKKAAHK